jgi:hypothetical protein
MDRRPSLRYGHFVVCLILLAATLAASGCTSALATAVWLIKGPNMPAEFDGLRGKKVVVVCRPFSSSLYANPGIAKDISRQVGLLLKEQVRGIEVIDERKVAEWIDNNTWDDYTEIGEALEADFVMGIDLEHFSVLQSQTLLQGKANYAINLYDCATGELVFEKQPPQTVYPPNHVISVQDRQEADFRREFVRILADEIARHFFAHDPHADFAKDATAMH